MPGPRWLPGTIAALVLATGIATALATGTGLGGPGGGHRTGPHARPTAAAATCHKIIGPVSRAALANGMPESPGAAGCPPAPVPNPYPGGSQLQSPTLCLPLHVEPGQRAARAGLQRRCFHSLV
jgi:hypothetical protein